MSVRPWNLLLLAALVCTAPSALGKRAATPTPRCGAIQGIEALLKPGRVLLLGEMHGTRESPAFLVDAACHAVAAGHAVTVGLELPQSDQPRIDAYLRSPGKPADRQGLFSSFWTKSYQDGRTSLAMAEAIEALRALRGGGHPLRVVLLDDPSGGDRDQAMALRLSDAVEERPGDVFITLTGNIHNRTQIGAPWNPAYEPMGYVASQLLAPGSILSLNVSHTGGTAWVCLSGEPCQVQSLGGRGEGDTVRVTVYEDVDERGYHGRYDVGAISASLPAARGGQATEDQKRPR